MTINILTGSFEKWLKTLEYAPGTINISVSCVTDFFFYLKTIRTEKEEITPEQITPLMISDYHQHLQTRKNKRQPGSLSSNTITANINALKRFSRYLQESGQPFFEVEVKTNLDKDTIKTILTTEDIKALYKACDDSVTEQGYMLGLRDRAILSVYYGCGLRRSEGVSLDLKDVMLKEKLLFVRSGKGYKERYVPMSEAVKEDLGNYIYQSREWIESIKRSKNEAFFLSVQSKRMCANALIKRIHKLAETAQLQKETGLHILRHSIATHLLQYGMTLEEISRFLGHSSLGSTQIYTHIVNETI